MQQQSADEQRSSPPQADSSQCANGAAAVLLRVAAQLQQKQQAKMGGVLKGVGTTPVLGGAYWVHLRTQQLVSIRIGDGPHGYHATDSVRGAQVVPCCA